MRIGKHEDEEEDEAVKWQRWERGVRRCSYKDTLSTFCNQGFLENRSMICAPPDSPKWFTGPLPGLLLNYSPYRPFIATICYYSPNFRRLLRHLLRLSNYYCTTITPVFSP